MTAPGKMGAAARGRAALRQFPAAGAVALLLAGCAATEPYQRADAWSISGANAANLAAMTERPTDLARGRGLGAAQSTAATDAVTRLRQGHVKTLIDTASSGSGAASGSSASSGN